MHTEEKKFGLILSLVCGGLGFYPLAQSGRLAPAWLVAGGLLLVISFGIPRVLGPLLKVWLKIGHVLARINTTLILGLVFIVILTPMACFRRILGHDPMGMRKTKNSYWLNREDDWPIDSYRKQF